MPGGIYFGAPAPMPLNLYRALLRSIRATIAGSKSLSRDIMGGLCKHKRSPVLEGHRVRALRASEI